MTNYKEITNYEEVKENIIKALRMKGNNRMMHINVLLVPWASKEKFNDVVYFSAIWSRIRNVKISIRRQKWSEFVRYTILG